MNKNKKMIQKGAGVPWFFLGLMGLILSLAMGFAVIPQTWAAQSIMVVYQQDGHRVFGRETSLDIFNNPRLDGAKIIHPFAEGSYTFAVQNISDSEPLPYVLNLTEINEHDVPIVVSLQKNGGFVLGGESEMLSLGEFDFPETQLAGGQTDTFTLNWMWETESDEADTALGYIGTQLYSIVITATGTTNLDTDNNGTDDNDTGDNGNVESEVGPENDTENGAGNENGAGGGAGSGESPRTGDDTRFVLWIGLMLASMTLCLWALCKRRKKDDDEEAPGSENL